MGRKKDRLDIRGGDYNLRNYAWNRCAYCFKYIRMKDFQRKVAFRDLKNPAMPGGRETYHVECKEKLSSRQTAQRNPPFGE